MLKSLKIPRSLVSSVLDYTIRLRYMLGVAGLDVIQIGYEGQLWVDSGLWRSPLNFQTGNLLCCPERPERVRRRLPS